MSKKYELTNERIKVGSSTLYRIKSLIDFGDVKEGDLGGFIAYEKNLSHKGKCWVYDNAQVYDNARVYGNARLWGNAQVFGNAQVCGCAWVRENAWVCENAHVYGDAEIYGDAWVYENAWVFDNAGVCGNSKIFGKARVGGNDWICKDARISGNDNVRSCSRVDGDTPPCDMNNVSELKVGDVVTVNSGGPKMTIVSKTDSKCTCIWFSNFNPVMQPFDVACLTKSTIKN